MKTRGITVNVGRHRPARQRRAFGRIIRRILARPSTTIGWQEIGEADGKVNEPRKLRRRFPWAMGWRHYGVGLRTPITINWLIWNPEQVRRVLAMKGIRNVSPNRFIIIVRLRRRHGRKAKRHPFTRINTHFVRDPAGSRRRRKLWDAHWRELRAQVATEHDAGRDQLVTMDANRRDLSPEDLHPAAVIAWQRGLDYVIAIPAPGRRVKVRRKGGLWLGVDGHRAGYADVSFEATR